MTRDSLLRVALRAIGVGIAIAGLLDPSITRRRAARPDVVVLAVDSASDGSAADNVARLIAKSYTVSREVSSGASATVVVGRTLPSVPLSLDVPVFAVAPAGVSIRVESVVAPATSPALARVRVATTIRVIGARGKSVGIALRDGSVAVDHASRRIARDDDTLAVALTFIPATSGTAALRVIAHVDGASDAIADASIDVRERKWAVLFYDAQPSWMSTFVRRAIERDPRFVATSRVVTSRDINTDAGNPPNRLDDLVALSLFDAVVLGAPQAISANDAAGLEAFMRRRGGSVVLLLDETGRGPHDRLMGVPAFASTTGNQPVALAAVDYDSLRLQATAMAWPTALPSGARIVAGGVHPIIWEEPVGAGKLVVSGAFDAWRYRDPASSSFDAFWQTTIADAANATPAPITIATSTSIVAPGKRFDVDATLRDEAIDAGKTSVAPLQVNASVTASSDKGMPFDIWPRAIGHLAARVRAPSVPGVYQVALLVGDRRAATPIIVAVNSHVVEPGAEPQLRDWVLGTGGKMLNESDITRLPALLNKAIRIDRQLVTWHPLRSAWWIVPLVIALAGEWWLRRRRGLA